MINTVSRKSVNATAAICTHLIELECYFYPLRCLLIVPVAVLRRAMLVLAEDAIEPAGPDMYLYL